MKKQLLAAAIAALAVSGTAVAHEAGDVILRVGVAHVAPEDSSSKISTSVTGKISGTKATVDSNTQLGLTGTYIVAPHFGIEVLAATPFTHKVKVKGLPGVYSAANGSFGEVTHLPPTVSAQYFFLNPKSKFQPYVGAGLNYTFFFNEKLNSKQKGNRFHGLDLENSWGWALQLGADVALADNIFLNAAIWKIDINTKATSRHEDLGKVKVDVEVDPWVAFVGVGFKF
jgi:outer membrane protein